MRKKPIKLGIGLPSYNLGCVGTYALECLGRSERIEHCQYFEQANSLLASNCNMLWCQALNAARRGELTHYLQIHSDVRPRANVMPHWFDVFLGEMEQAECDVLSAIIPIKNTSGYTSTALDTDRWNPQRLTQQQVNRELPATWTCASLLFNTGLLLIDLRGKWTKNPPFFTINDEIVQDGEGNWGVHCEPEDWNFSRQCRELGLKYFVTRKVPVDHFGIAGWSSDGIWGHPVDMECVVPSGSVEIIEATGEVKSFAPVLQDPLPAGWFSPTDIEHYREIYEQLPAGGKAVEIGVYRGRSIISVADIIKARGLHVVCVDRFTSYGSDSSTDRYEQFMQTLREHQLEEHITVAPGLSAERSRIFPNASFDFVFIDGDHSYEGVSADIEAWLPKVRSGGLIGGHDFDNEPGVMRAVMEYFRNPNPRPWNDSSIWLVRR